MSTIEFHVYNQTIHPSGLHPPVASDSIDFIPCTFCFDEQWDNMTRVAQFTQGTSTYNVLLDELGCCMLPSELVSGEVAISVFGQIAGETVRATTIPYMLQLRPSGFVGDTATSPVPPTPDLYSQLLSNINAAVVAHERAEEAQIHAEEAQQGAVVAQVAAEVAQAGATKAQSAVQEMLTQTEYAQDAAEAAQRVAENAHHGASQAQQAIEDMSVTAVSGVAGSDATVAKSTLDGVVHLEISVPRGDTGAVGPTGATGATGPQGEPGLNGVAVSVAGTYAFNVDEDGHLILHYTGNDTPEFSVSENGHLILTI